MSASVIGKKFTIDSACPTHKTDVGMFAVISKYDRNAGRSRMEADIMIWKDSDEHHALAAAQHFASGAAAGGPPYAQPWLDRFV